MSPGASRPHGQRETGGTHVSPQEVAGALGLGHHNRLNTWSWEALMDAAVVLYWQRRPVPVRRAVKEAS